VNPLPDGVERAFPYAPRFFNAGGARMHYIDEGQGPAVVLVHGNPTWSFYFRRVIEDLRRDHRVIAVDHVGCGRSDKPENYPYTLRTHVENLEGLIESLGLARLSLVLHDWGGIIGAGYAVRHPGRIDRWALMNTAAFWPTGYLPRRLRLARTPYLGEFLIRRFNLFARLALRQAVARPERLTPAIRAGYLAPYDSHAHRVATARFVQDIPATPRDASFALATDIAASLPGLAHLPTRIFWGEKDPVFNDRFLREWARLFPRAVVERYADAGHYVLEDAHERILPALRAFLTAPAP
jgi:pimeloyl-ACP methyl ester carboxylesterase